MKTIFISSFHQLISRNILATPLLELLLQSGDIRIVILVPADKQNFFQSEFGRDGIVIEGVPRTLTPRDFLLRYFALSSVTARGIEVIRKKEYDNFNSRFLRVLGRRAWGQGLIREIDKWLTPRGRFGALLDKYQPALIFSTDAQNENDVRLMHEARARGIRIFGMVRSWDNFTTKGALRIISDTLAVTSEIVKREAEAFSFVPEARIVPIGIPHYDRYLQRSKMPREEFYRSLGLDAAKKTILFAPIGNRYIRDNLLDKIVLESLAILDVNVLVRMPPSDYVNFENWKKGRANVVFYTPGGGSPSGDKDRKLNEVTREDDNHLIAELTHCDIVVTGQSTITIDAMMFDKPAVIIYFDQEERQYYESIKRYYDSEYYRPVVESGGVQLARSSEELKTFVERYLENSRLDEEGRRRIASEQAYKIDGKATERLAQVLLSSLRAA